MLSSKKNVELKFSSTLPTNIVVATVFDLGQLEKSMAILTIHV